MENMLMTLSQVRDANVQWFSRGNKAFFQDVSYGILHSKEGKPFLVRSTYGWSDMCGGKKRLVYRINEINEDLTIGALLDETFKTRDEAKYFIKHYEEVPEQ